MERRGQELWLDQESHRVAGANIYSFAYRTADEQSRLLDLAQAFGFNTLRIWAFNDQQLPAADQVCFQWLRPGAVAPEIREGAYGLNRLDNAVRLAGERGVRLILTLTNYHPDYGGMPRYQQWLGLTDLHDFYRDPGALAVFQGYAAAIVARYRNNPAVLAWEIANEPRCPDNTALLTDWLARMSGFLRTQAPRQLIAAGDEGFFSRKRAGNNWLFNGSRGVSCEDILAIPAIDFGTYHLYPDQWVKKEDPLAFGQMWIAEHIAAGKRANKPMLLEEFGLPPSSDRDAIYAAWREAVELQAGAGSLVWMLGEAGQGDQYLLSSLSDAPSLAVRVS